MTYTGDGLDLGPDYDPICQVFPSFPDCDATAPEDLVRFLTNAANEPQRVANGDDEAGGGETGGETEERFDQRGFVFLFSSSTDPTYFEALPRSVDFGDVAVGCRSAELPVTIYNPGSSSLDVMRLDTSENSAFSVVRTEPARESPTLPLTVSRGGSLKVWLRYTPLTDGNDAGELLIEADTSCSLVSISLSGRGVAERSITDVWEVPVEPKIDVLWVVDNSNTMADKQAALASGFAKFVMLHNSLALDYQIAMTSTEVNDSYESKCKGRIGPGLLHACPGKPKFVTPDTPDGAAVLTENLAGLGTCCSESRESPLQAAHLALEEPNVSDPSLNGGFLRESADFYLVFVTDEDDKSDASVQFYADFFKGLKGTRNSDRIGASIVAGLSAGGNPKPQDCTGSGGDGYAATRLYDFYQQINNGFATSICEAGWGSVYDTLDKEWYGQRALAYRLSRAAKGLTIEVKVNGRVIPQDTTGSGTGWTYDEENNEVVFGRNTTPPRGAKIEVSYTAQCI